MKNMKTGYIFKYPSIIFRVCKSNELLKSDFIKASFIFALKNYLHFRRKDKARNVLFRVRHGKQRDKGSEEQTDMLTACCNEGLERQTNTEADEVATHR